MTPTPTEETRPPSRKRFSLKLWIGVPCALILVLVIILSQIDLESVKENLVQRISRETGLKVAMESIGFSFSQGLGLQLKGVKVSSPEGNSFSVERLHLLAEWGPLLKGEFKIKSVTLEHPEATLEIPKTSPEPLPTSEDKASEKPLPKAKLIDPVKIQSAAIKVKSTRLSIKKLIVSDGKITLIRAGTAKQVALNVDGTFVLNQSEHLDIAAKTIQLQTGTIIFTGDGMASNLTEDNAGISLNLKSNSFSWEEAQPVLDFLSDKIKDAPLETVDVHQLSIRAEISVSSLIQIETLQKQMLGHVKLKTRNLVLKLGNKSYPIESLEGEGNLEKGVLTHNFSGTALASDFKLHGELPLFNLEKDSISRVEWKNLMLEKLPLAKDLAWIPTQGKVSGSLSLTGPIPKEKEPFPGKVAVDFLVEGLVLKPANPNRSRPIEVSHLKGHGDFHQGLLQHEIHATVWGSDFDIKGKLRLSQDNLVLNSRINWQDLDVSQLPYPSNTGWQATEGKLSGTLTLAGPAPGAGEKFPGRLKTSLKFNAENLKLQNENSPLLFLNQLEGTGNIANHRVNYNIKGNTFNGTFHSDGNITLSASGSSPLVLNNQIEFANLDLSQLPLPLPATGGNISGSLKLNGPLPDAGNLLTGRLKIDTRFKVTNLNISAGSLALDIPRLEGKATLNRGRLKHDLNGTLFGGSVNTKGTLTFQKKNEQTLISANSDLVLDKVNLDWLPLIHKSEWTPSSGMVTGNLKIKGPLPSNGKISPALKLQGTLEGKKLVLGNPQKQVDTLKLEFKESSSTLTQVQVELEKIKLGDRNFKKVVGLFQITTEKIDLKQGRIWPMNGLIKLVGDFKPESGSYRLKFKGDKLKVEEFLSPHLMGPLQLSGTLSGILPQNTDTPGIPDYSRDLSGDIKIKLANGTLPKLGALEQFLTLLNPISVLDTRKTGLGYDYLGGNFKILKGVVHTSNLEMKGPQIMLNVEGKANLVEDSVLAQVKAMPLQMLDKTLKAIPLLGQILTGGKKGGLIETYFKVHGKLSKPDFTLQPHKSLLEKPGSILKELFKLGE